MIRPRWPRLLCALLMLADPVSAEEPQRIVSLNLCTDAMLLELVEPARIASLTYMSHDPDYAAWVEEARDLPTNHGLIEEILPLNTDLILAGSFSARPTVQLLQKLGYRVALFDPVSGIDGYREDLRHLAALLGAEERAERLLVDLDRRMSALAPPPALERPLAMVYGANGFTAGRGSLIDDLLQQAGLRNLATELGIGMVGRLSLEEVLLATPEVLIVGEYRPEEPARAQQLLRHRALQALMAQPGRRLVTIPAHWWNCPGRHMLDALERLARTRAQLLAAPVGR